MAGYEYDVLISYTGPDRAPAQVVCDDLLAYGASVWFDKISMPHDHGFDANQIRDELVTAMRKSRALLILVSARSMASRWVKFELDTAIALEAHNPSRRILILMVGRGSERDIPDAIRDRRMIDLRDHFEQRYKIHRMEIFREILQHFEPGRFRELFG